MIAPMCTFDWTSYVGEQIKWAEALIIQADNIQGDEANILRAKSATILADVSRLVGEGLTGSELATSGIKEEMRN